MRKHVGNDSDLLRRLRAENPRLGEDPTLSTPEKLAKALRVKVAKLIE